MRYGGIKMIKTGKQILNENQLGNSFDKKPVAFSCSQFIESMLDLINLDGGKKLLDVGCGQGVFLKHAVKRNISCFGIDLSKRALESARKDSFGIYFVEGSGENLPWSNNFFNCVTIFGALEHFLNPEKGVKEIARVLKKDGIVLVVVPNEDFIYWLVTGKEPNVGMELERYANESEWKNLIEENGLKVIKTNYYSCPSTWTGFKRIVGKFFEFFIPKKYSYHFVFVCKRRIVKK